MKLFFIVLVTLLFGLPLYAQIQIPQVENANFEQKKEGSIKVDLYSDAIVPDGDCPSTITYAGKTYNTVKIGEHCWLKDNLDIGTMIESNDEEDNQTDNGTIEKYCYDNDHNNCEKYGGLYQWNEAMQYITTEGTKGICPVGWHIPTRSEFEELEDYVGDEAKRLLAEGETDEATNETGFSALLGGNRYNVNGNFDFLGNFANFWSSSELNTKDAYYLTLTNYASDVGLSKYNKGDGFSVRCIKD